MTSIRVAAYFAGGLVLGIATAQNINWIIGVIG
jgi:hypothetical protein